MNSTIDKLQVKKRLQDARAEIGKSRIPREEVHIQQASDTMDQVQAAEARELAITNLTRSARTLRQIEEALRRLETGGYGTCSICEEEIAPKRLGVIPWAPLCLHCQDLADRSENHEDADYADRSLIEAA